MTDVNQRIIADLIEAGDHLIETTSPAAIQGNALMRWSAAKDNAMFPRCTNCGVPLYSRQHHLPETLGRCRVFEDEGA